MLRIRFSRTGRKASPSYRIVLLDSRKKRDGAYLDLIGTYNPFSKETRIDFDLYNKYVSQGAKPSDAVLRLVDQNKHE